MVNSYLLAYRGKFFHRFLDGEFPTKWCGFWDKTKKYLEYFAIKINDEWLSKNNHSGFVQDLNTAIHYYETKDFYVRETIKLNNALEIDLKLFNKSNSSKNVRIEIEFAVNFRNFDEGVIEKKYSTEYFENKCVIKSEDRKLIFKSSKEGMFIGSEYQKIHYPSNQQFKCFVPKRFVIYDFADNSYSIKFYFFIENETLKKDKIEKFLLKNKLNCNIDFINELYKIALINLRSCFDGNAFIAGYPWYAYYWSRDAAFSSIGASLTSMQNFAKKTILFFFKYFDERFPNFILDKKISYNSKDSLPLFLVALEEYLKNSSGFEILKILKSKLERAFEYYRNNANEKGFIYSEANETWMDTLGREGYNLEIQVFWYRALKSLSVFFELLSNKKLEEEARFYSNNLKNKIIEHFLVDGVFIDNLNSKKVTINSIFPFVFGVSSDYEIFKNIENHLKETYGFLSLSKFDKDFDENSYQLGASWFHMNALVSYVYFKFGKFEEALKILKSLYEMKDAYCKNCLIEVYNARNKNIYVKKPIGIEETSYLQAWSAANVIFAIQKGLLGLDVNSLTKSIFFKPYLNFYLRRRIGNDLIEISYFNNSVKYKSLKNKKYKVILKYV